METAASVIKSALQELLVQAAEAPLEASEVQDAIKYMNRMMARLAATGINLGYTKVTGLADPITIPDGAIDGLVFNLAIGISTQYGGVVTQALSFNAREGLEAMEFLGVNISPTSYGDTMPIGSGNEGDYPRNDHFYDDLDEAVLTEQSGFIAVESGTPV
jgi:hypothetical protein